jgi:1-acyl-sn-glycerol-3-phosphate acyltransferase
VVFLDPNTTTNQPKIIASNHPNSFFDAIVIAVHYPEPIYFLARGDAFKKPVVARFLKALQLIPIYRLSEGKENLSKNGATFDRCLSLFKKSRTILIFSEGLCVNEWRLRSLKKGTARLALMAKKAAITNLKIQPTTLNYSSFSANPKQIALHFNAEFNVSAWNNHNESQFYAKFNNSLRAGISETLIEADQVDSIRLFNHKTSAIRKTILAIPAAIGFILNRSFYKTIKKFAQKKTKNTVFYDSVLFGLLFLVYPIFVLVVSLAAAILLNWIIGLTLFVIFPLSAYCYSQFKS